MDRDEFWQRINAARSRTPAELEAGLRSELESLPLQDVVSFQQHFDQLFDSAYRWDLWGAAYLIEGGCSDDGFTDFRYGLIALGRGSFDAALVEPDSLVNVDEFIPNETFGYVATQLIEEKSGKPHDERYAEGPSDPIGQNWDFDDSSEMSGRYPRLWERYGA